MSTQNATVVMCANYDAIMKMWFEFGILNLIRVVVTWLLFACSLAGNFFVIYTLSVTQTSHTMTLYLSISNIAYTVFVMPLDAIWNTTMHWLAGDAVCRISQMMKQFGMYASSFMVVVVALDRCTAIVRPVGSDGQKKRGVSMVIAGWCASFLCSIPAVVLFSQASIPTCEGITLYQCVDFLVVEDQHKRAGYYFFSMLITFVLPLVTTIVCYSLIIWEISNMNLREQALMGRRHSASSTCMHKATRKSALITSIITASFLICWGPYYGKGIVDWFQPGEQRPPAATETLMYVMMYLNPVLHPFVFGIFIKEIRSKFYALSNQFKCTTSEKKHRVPLTPRLSLSYSTTGATNVPFSSRASEMFSINFKSNTSSPTKSLLSEGVSCLKHQSLVL